MNGNWLTLGGGWRLIGRGCCGKQQRDQAKQKGRIERKCCNSYAEPSCCVCLFNFPIASGQISHSPNTL